jgi:catalase
MHNQSSMRPEHCANSQLYWSDLQVSRLASGKVLTTNQGAPVDNNAESLTVGQRGPVLLEDYHLLEKIAHFDRERIPERVVHARGAAAKGYFEASHPPLLSQ